MAYLIILLAGLLISNLVSLKILHSEKLGEAELAALHVAFEAYSAEQKEVVAKLIHCSVNEACTDLLIVDGVVITGLIFLMCIVK